MEPMVRRYLDVVKASVLGELWIDEHALLRCMRQSILKDRSVNARLLWYYASLAHDELREHVESLRHALDTGGSSDVFGLTMTGKKRLENVEDCLVAVVKEGIPGDFVETGVWRGGCSLYAKAVLVALGDRERSVWLADSFDGLPAPTHDADVGARINLSKTSRPQYAIARSRVEDHFKRYDLLDDRVRFLEGWFKDTLPGAPIERIAVLRLDGDLYESTMDALSSLYRKVVPGGFVIIDDYFPFEVCRAAVTDFRKAQGIGEEIVDIDGTAVYWRRPR